MKGTIKRCFCLHYMSEKGGGGTGVEQRDETQETGKIRALAWTDQAMHREHHSS